MREQSSQLRQCSNALPGGRLWSYGRKELVIPVITSEHLAYTVTSGDPQAQTYLVALGYPMAEMPGDTPGHAPLYSYTYIV